MTHHNPEQHEDLARSLLTAAHDQALTQREGDRATPHDLWATARRRQTRRRGAGAVVLGAAVIGVSTPLWWPSSQPVTNQAAVTSQPSETVGPAGPSTQPEDGVPTTLPDGQPYDHEKAMVGDRANDIIDAVRDELGYAGLHVDPQSQDIILHWAGPAPDSVVAQARELAAPSELVVDPTARFSRADLIAVMEMVSDQTTEELKMMRMEPNYLTGQITVRALPESPLHTATDPAALMGIADEGVDVKVVLLEPEDIPILGNG